MGARAACRDAGQDEQRRQHAGRRSLLRADERAIAGERAELHLAQEDRRSEIAQVVELGSDSPSVGPTEAAEVAAPEGPRRCGRSPLSPYPDPGRIASV